MLCIDCAAVATEDIPVVFLGGVISFLQELPDITNNPAAAIAKNFVPIVFMLLRFLFVGY
jgi:hypothetical protein